MIRLALTGGRGAGKTSLLLALAERLAAAGVRVGGVVQPVVLGLAAGQPAAPGMAAAGGPRPERLGYDLLDLATRQRWPLARRAAGWRPAAAAAGGRAPVISSAEGGQSAPGETVTATGGRHQAGTDQAPLAAANSALTAADAPASARRCYEFDEAAFDRAAAVLAGAAASAAVVCVDELGLLELGGGGHLPAVLTALAAPHACRWCFALRREAAHDLLPLLGVPVVNLLDLDALDAARALDMLAQRLG